MPGRRASRRVGDRRGQCCRRDSDVRLFAGGRQPVLGARVEQLGIGVHERFADLDQDRLETGLRRAMHPEVITRSRAIGDTVRADTGAAGRAADLIESKLPD